MEKEEAIVVTVHPDNARIIEELRKPPMVTVRGDILAPLLVYMNKFFQCVNRTNANGLSRFMRSEDYRLAIELEGFSPEDWNAMMSLAKSAGADLEETLNKLAGHTPQMAKPELRAAERARGSGMLNPPKHRKTVMDARAEANKLIARMETTDGEEVEAVVETR